MNRISNIWVVALGFLIAYSGIGFSQAGWKATASTRSDNSVTKRERPP